MHFCSRYWVSRLISKMSTPRKPIIFHSALQLGSAKSSPPTILGMKFGFGIETDYKPFWYYSLLPNSWTACLHEFFDSDSGLQDLTTASSMFLESCCTLQTRFLGHHCQKQKVMKPYRRKLNLSWQLGCSTCPQVKQGWTNIEEFKLPTQSVPQQSTTACRNGWPEKLALFGGCTKEK